MSNLKITVVTVCYNAEKTIRKAIESVLEQQYCNYEYIVVDGLSTDDTYNFVKSYDSAFRDKGIRYEHVSEKDTGIWNAMNKAIMMAKGEWIIFINADDKLHDDRVLSDVFYSNNYEEYDVIYGNVLRISNETSFIGKANPVDIIKLNMPFCHQGSFTRANILKKYQFDEKFRVADYNFFLNLYLNGGKYYQIDRTIADYSTEGYSNQDKYKTYLGTVIVRDAHGLINKNSLKQKIKDYYFLQLLDEQQVFHKIISWVDSKFSRRKA